MATISNLDLSVGKRSGTDAKEFIMVRFKVTYTLEERNYSPGFYIRTYLFEVEGQRDNLFIQDVSGGIFNATKVNNEIEDKGYYLPLIDRVKNPNQNENYSYTFDLDLGSFETLIEKFYAVVSVCPAFPDNIRPHFTHSPIVMIDVDS